MSEWLLPTAVVAGIGLGVIFTIAALGWFAWHLYGRHAAHTSSEAWQNKLAVFFGVPRKPVTPLDVSDPDHPAAVSARARMAEQWPSVDRGDLS